MASGILIGGVMRIGRAIRPPFEDDPRAVREELLRLVDAGVDRFYMGHGGRSTPKRCAAMRKRSRCVRIEGSAQGDRKTGSGIVMTHWREAIDSYINSQAERWCSIRRYLHAHPEPSREEFGTTQYLARQLEDAGLGADHALGPRPDRRAE